jgi:hypothetical protein
VNKCGGFKECVVAFAHDLSVTHEYWLSSLISLNVATNQTSTHFKVQTHERWCADYSSSCARFHFFLVIQLTKKRNIVYGRFITAELEVFAKLLSETILGSYSKLLSEVVLNCHHITIFLLVASATAGCHQRQNLTDFGLCLNFFLYGVWGRSVSI